MKIYALLTLVSFIIRQYFLPNPFESLGGKGIIINYIATAVITAVSYFLVGLVYKSFSNPVVGSILFLIIYSVIVVLLYVMGIFNFAVWWIIVVIILFIVIIVLLKLLINRLSRYTEKYDI